MTILTSRGASVGRQAPPWTRRWRWIPLAGAAGWILAVTIATALAPADYNSVRDTISALAAADNPFGWVMVAGFIAHGHRAGRGRGRPVAMATRSRRTHRRRRGRDRRRRHPGGRGSTASPATRAWPTARRRSSRLCRRPR